MAALLVRRICTLYNLLSSLLLCLLPKKLRNSLLHPTPPPPPPPSPSTSTTPADLLRVFQTFDRNGDGRITLEELEESLLNLGISVPREELADMIRGIDVNGNGCVDLDEFGSLYGLLSEERDADAEDDVREAFNVFDRDGDGFITVEELESVLASLGLKQGRAVEDCRKMITKVDADGDGMVDYEEFRQMMRGGGVAVLA
ncbi:hypothetical protein MLD38_016209 [Melastoma candidum]|uniref:Uncharacterized protein n=1 Tax=Melastoma candidum TaxID=119954 RepID=A0ACB9RKM7_9MYRT|nr:hypothetical protein MLD38_016209 [Melastoma candidum]